MTDVLTSCVQGTRAAALVLDHAHQAGLPDPRSVAIGRRYDTEVSRDTPSINLQFQTADDLQSWARHLNLTVTSRRRYATNGSGRVASLWSHAAVTEWLDVPLSLTAVTEHPIRGLEVVR